MTNMPPAFVPAGSQQVKPNAYVQNRMPLTFNPFKSYSKTQPSEWVNNKKQDDKDNVKKI